MFARSLLFDPIHHFGQARAQAWVSAELLARGPTSVYRARKRRAIGAWFCAFGRNRSPIERFGSQPVQQAAMNPFFRPPVNADQRR